MRLSLPTVLASLTIAATVVAQRPAPPTTYEQALARYQECLQRKAFDYHTEGRSTLAQWRSLEALQVLSADYAKPKYVAETKLGDAKMVAEYVRYTLATLFGRHFEFAEAVPALTALREANDKPIDTWLWVQTLRVAADNGGEAGVLEIAQTSKNWFHRAAAITALGAAKRGDLKGAVIQNCIEFPKKESDRNLLIGAMSSAFWEQRSRVNTEDYREALKAYIGLLGEEVGLTHTAKVQIARHLQWILKGPALFVTPDPWLELLLRGDVKKTSSGETSVAPRFFGVETDGERLCYVVDMSDSMLIAIEPSAKPAAASGPITGQKAPKKKKALLDESDLPWDKIQTRWDLAREQLKISLWRLTPDKHFAVVWFGDGSGTLNATKGMVKATKANIDRAVAELDGIKPQDPAPDQPADGVVLNGKRQVLRGNTNMHSGLRRAFGLAGSKGFVDEVAYVDSETLTEGCDTMFLLSDGAPTVDDFYVLEKNYGEKPVVRNLETSEAATGTPQVWASGPFTIDPWIVDDVRRMNAFRRIRMHCIGLGEANEGLLKRLAEVCHGETFTFGKKK